MTISDLSWQMKVSGKPELNKVNGNPWAYLMRDISAANNAATTRVVYGKSVEEAIELYVEAGLCPSGKATIILTAETGEVASYEEPVKEESIEEVSTYADEADEGNDELDNGEAVSSETDEVDGSSAGYPEGTDAGGFEAGTDEGRSGESGDAESVSGTEGTVAYADESGSERGEAADAGDCESINSGLDEEAVSLTKEEISGLLGETSIDEEAPLTPEAAVEETVAEIEEVVTEVEEEVETVPSSEETEVKEPVEVVKESTAVEDSSYAVATEEVTEETTVEEVTEEPATEEVTVEEAVEEQPVKNEVTARIRLVSTGELAWEVKMDPSWYDYIAWILNPANHNLVKSEPGQAAIFIDKVVE